MNQDYDLQVDLEWDLYEEMHRLIEVNPWTWQSIGAVSGLIGGVLSPVIGTLLIAVTWFIHSERIVSSLNGLSIISFVLTIPLLSFGAHCLDLLEEKTARLSLLRRKVVSDG
jgi:ABC-type transport system involved in cytochrome c biogenesis permease component